MIIFNFEHVNYYVTVRCVYVCYESSRTNNPKHLVKIKRMSLELSVLLHCGQQLMVTAFSTLGHKNKPGDAGRNTRSRHCNIYKIA
jgi:hypothetical protein